MASAILDADVCPCLQPWHQPPAGPPEGHWHWYCGGARPVPDANCSLATCHHACLSCTCAAQLLHACMENMLLEMPECCACIHLFQFLWHCGECFQKSIGPAPCAVQCIQSMHGEVVYLGRVHYTWFTVVVCLLIRLMTRNAGFIVYASSQCNYGDRDRNPLLTPSVMLSQKELDTKSRRWALSIYISQWKAFANAFNTFWSQHPAEVWIKVQIQVTHSPLRVIHRT